MKRNNGTLGPVAPINALSEETLKEGSRLRSSYRPALALFVPLLVISIVLTACLAPPVTQNVPHPTSIPTTAVPRPVVQAFPSMITAGMNVTVLGLDFKPNEQLVFYLRDASRPTQPILQLGKIQASQQGTFEWSFTYPSAAPWASITNASVIVQSAATKMYFTTDLTTMPADFPTSTTIIPTRILPTVGATVTVSPPACNPRTDWPRYIVLPGDTLLSISQMTRTSIEALKQANCLSNDIIFVGQQLFVVSLPPAPTLPLPATPIPPLDTPTSLAPPPVTPTPIVLPTVPPTLPPVTPTPIVLPTVLPTLPPPTRTPSPIVPPTVPVTSQPPTATPIVRPPVTP